MGTLDPDASGAVFGDNGDGTGTLTITLKDLCGNPILPEDFPIVPPTSTYISPSASFQNYFRANSESKDGDHFYYIGASHFPVSEGFTRANHEGAGIYYHTITKPCGYEDTWEIGIGPWLFRDDVFVIEEVEIIIAPKPVLWTGTWDTIWDFYGESGYETLMILTQDEEGNVTGEYSYAGCDDGAISGTVNGYVLTGICTESGADYPIEFTMSCDGESFEGTWSDGAVVQGYWNGTRE